jgi:membrane protein
MSWLSGGVAAATRAVGRAREKAGWFDHLVRAGGRYRRDTGDRLAASITYYAFLSFFPLVLLGLSLTGFVLNRDPALHQQVIDRMGDYLPGIYDGIKDNLDTVLRNRAKAGAIGLVALVWAGLGWLDSLRDALRIMWHHDLDMGNIARKKLLDVVTLAGLGATIAVSLVATGLVAASSGWVLERLGLQGTSGLASVATVVAGFAVGLVADTAFFGYLFTRLPRIGRPFSQVAKGAVFAAVGFGVLKLVGRFYIVRFITVGSRVFGTLAVVAGLLVWMNLVARFTLYAAAWTVTGPYADDALPSGTSSREAAREAGLSAAQRQAIKEPGVPASSVLSKDALTAERPRQARY